MVKCIEDPGYWSWKDSAGMEGSLTTEQSRRIVSFSDLYFFRFTCRDQALVLYRQDQKEMFGSDLHIGDWEINKIDKLPSFPQANFDIK